jgi:hypothetical protein
VPAKTIFPSRRSLWIGALVYPLFALVCGAVTVNEATSGSLSWGDTYLAAGLACFGYATLAIVRQFRRPLPAVTLDEDGIECDLGRERWENVERVDVRWRWLGRTIVRRLVLWIRGAAPELPATGHRFAGPFVYGRPSVYGDRIELPLWASKQRVLDDVREFYAGPIG